MALEEMAISAWAVGVFYPAGCRRLRCWTQPNPPEAPKRGVYLFDSSGDLIRVRRITGDQTFWFERLTRDQWDTGQAYRRFLAKQGGGLMLRVRPLLENDSRRCGECGRAWWELCGYRGCPERQWVELRGAIGTDHVRVMLCPECSDELLEVLWVAFGYSLAELREDQAWEREKLPCLETPEVPSLVAFMQAKNETA